MNSTATSGTVPRFKRDSREDACEGLEYGSTIVEMVADVAGDINSIPVIGKVAGVVTGCVAAVSHVTKAGMAIANTALKCDDIPFEEIKEIMDTRFNEVDRKLDQNAEALGKINDLVSKTKDTVEKMRFEMAKGFERVVYAIEHNSVKVKVTQINNFLEYFLSEKDRIRKLPKEDYVAKLEEQNGFLHHLKESRTPGGDTLHTAMYEIIHNSLAIPNDANDLKAFQALYALFYGTQSYGAIFCFLLESHSYLADNYYQNGDYEKFNKQIDIIKTVFEDFKFTLIGKNYGILMKVSDILKMIKNKPFTKNVKNDLYKEISGRSSVLEKLKSQIKEMNLPVIRDTPPTATMQFKKPDYNTPVGDWKSGIVVRYAVQLEKNGAYSKLSSWSESFTVKAKASPHVRVPIDPEGRNRLIFRRFGDDKPQLVGVMSKSQTEFRDISRDLYNAAGAIDKDAALAEVTKLLELGANVNAVYELGRSALHNAAKAGNVKVMKLLIEKGFNDINLKDQKGYTPLHVAADSGKSGIIPELVRKGADVTAVTNTDHYTPLHLGARNGYKSVVEELVRKRGVDVNAKDRNGFTPFHAAVNGSKNVVMAFYIRYDLDLNVKSDSGLTAVHLAAMKGDFKIIKALLLSNSFKLNASDNNKMTALHFAAMLGNSEMVRELLTLKGISVNPAAEGSKWTPLHFAIYFKKNEAAIELIKNSNTDVNFKAVSGNTPLHFAAATGQMDVVEELLKRGAKLEEKTEEGYTALHLAAMLEEEETAEFLVGKGANVAAKSNDNKTPLDIANQYENTSVANFLEKKTGRLFRKSILKEEFDIPRTNTNELYSDDWLKSRKLSHQNSNFVPIKFKSQIPQSFLKQIDGPSSFKRNELSSVQNVYSVGTILLLDVLLRLFTKEKYKSMASETDEKFDILTQALDVTEHISKFLNGLSDLRVDEYIDLSKVHSKVKKALKSGRIRANILCSNVEKALSQNSEELKNLLSTYRDSKSEDLENQVVGYLQSLLKNVCK